MPRTRVPGSGQVNVYGLNHHTIVDPGTDTLSAAELPRHTECAPGIVRQLGRIFGGIPENWK